MGLCYNKKSSLNSLVGSGQILKSILKAPLHEKYNTRGYAERLIQHLPCMPDLSAVCTDLSAVCTDLSAVCTDLSAVCTDLSAVCTDLSAVCTDLSAVCTDLTKCCVPT